MIQVGSERVMDLLQVHYRHNPYAFIQNAKVGLEK